MSEWIVYSKDGNTERCRLKSLEYSGTWMGERAVTATFEHYSEVVFEVFDYIEYRGEVFELEAVPTVKKTSSFDYSYDLRFVSKKYELERCEMRDIVPNDNGVVYPTPLTFSFTGDVRYLVQRIQACLDALYGEDVWNIVVADGVTSEEKNITIAQQNCWNALALVNTTYGLNFYVKGRTITIGGTQPAVAHTFEYGKGNGLYEIERASDTEKGIVTKLRAYGGTRNLDYSYPKQPEWSDSALPVSFALSPLRLMLPSFKTDGKTDFVLADDATIAKYGIREASMVYDDIYPTITGATNSSGQAIDEIKAVDEVDDTKSTFTIYLYDLGFDLEEHLTTSEAQLSMKSGTLQGYTFNISTIEKQSDGGYKLVLGRNSLEGSDESGFYVPNADWNMKAGDKFVFLNILMPQAYIREAEERLLARAEEYLAQYGKTNFSYNIGLHDKFLVEHASVYDSLLEGSKLSVRDAEIGIDEDVTIQSITITENMEENILPQVKVTLNNEPSASTLDRIQGKLNDIANETAANNFSSQSELMAQYRKKLDKPFFDKLFVAVDYDGNEIASNDTTTPVAYIKALYDVAVVGGVTMYVNDKSLNIPGIYEGLPIDNNTLIRDDNGVLMINPDIDLGGGASTWDELTGKPSWIGNTKPSYNYSEILQTPDLSVYALAKDLENYVTLNTEQTIAAHKNFLNGLSVGGLGITKSQDDVIYLDANLVVRGGITMYAEGTVDIPSIIDSLPIASTSAKGIASFNPNDFSVVDGYVSFIGSTGVDESVLANYAKKTDLSAYLPLSGGQMTGNIGYTLSPDSYEVGLPAAGAVYYTDFTGMLQSQKSFIASAYNETTGLWYNTISLRHRNGSGDGTKYGMYLYSAMTDYDNDGSLHFGRQINGTWQGERVILDSVNWSQYISTGQVGAYLPQSGGNMSGHIFMTGAVANSSTANTSQIVFGTSSNNHVCITSNMNGLIINPSLTDTSGQIALYADVNMESFIHSSLKVYGNLYADVYFNYNGNVAQSYGSSMYVWDNNLQINKTTSGNDYLKTIMSFDLIGENVAININGTLRINSYIRWYGHGTNPYIGITYGGRDWYLQAYNNAYIYLGTSIATSIRIDTDGNLLTAGGITMYSDIRKKTKLQDVELSLKQIADAPLIEHYYNSDAMRTTHVGSIAQYWAGLNDWFCKLDSEGFYTMEIQNAALASAISIARELTRYESKTDRTIRKLKQRISELEYKIEKLENN